MHPILVKNSPSLEKVGREKRADYVYFESVSIMYRTDCPDGAGSIEYTCGKP